MAAVTDFRVQIGFFSHLKTRRLERKLGAAGVLGLLRIWEYAATNAPDGMLRGCDDEELAIVAGWGGEPGDLVTGLMAAGFVFRAADGFELHDWAEHQSWVVSAPDRSQRSRRAAVAKHEKARGKSTTGKAEAVPSACPAHAQRNAESKSGTAPAFPAFPAFPAVRESPPDPPAAETEPETPTVGDDWRMAEDLARRSIREGRPPTPDRAGRRYPHTEALVGAWNRRVPPDRRLTDRQARQLARTVLPADLYPLDDLEAAIVAALANPVLAGRDGKWRATLPWLLEPQHWRDVLAGKYPLPAASPRAGPPVPPVAIAEYQAATPEDAWAARVEIRAGRLAAASGDDAFHAGDEDARRRLLALAEEQLVGEGAERPELENR